MIRYIFHWLAVSEVKYNSLPQVPAGDAQIQLVVNFIFGLAGALSLLFIVIGGMRYIISQGDPNAVGQAKNTIIYALVGLIVTVIAYSIVRFVVSSIT
jgi:hypothetical protein